MTQAVILAAGRGTRLGEIGSGVPKVLLTIQGKSLLEHHLSSIRKAGIERVVIVLGRHGSMWTDANVARIKELSSFEVVFNDENDETHSTWSIALSAALLENETTVFVDGDTLYDPSLIDQVIKKNKPTLVCSPNASLENKGTKIISQDGIVLGAGQQELSTQLTNTTDIGVYAGMMTVPVGDLASWLNITKQPRLKKQILEFALKEFVQTSKVSVLFDKSITNINTADDLEALHR